MTQDDTNQGWQVQDRFLELKSRWMTLIGEHWQDHQGNLLEYWRIEKADSVIVLPIQGDRLLLPTPSYRPGVGQVTLDFPGGRAPQGQDPKAIAIATLQRELELDAAAIMQLTPISTTGWAVNSSFSNQQLYGFVVQIDPAWKLSKLVAKTYPLTKDGIHDLLQELICLQCRAILLEWWTYWIMLSV
jgi:hypothetical protein